MNLDERRRQRSEDVLKEAREAIAQADEVLAKANDFFNGEGLQFKIAFEALPAEERERIQRESKQAVQELEREAIAAVQRKSFEQHKYGHKPSGGRRLV